MGSKPNISVTFLGSQHSYLLAISYSSWVNDFFHVIQLFQFSCLISLFARSQGCAIDTLIVGLASTACKQDSV